MENFVKKIEREFGAKMVGNTPPPSGGPGEMTLVVVTFRDIRVVTPFLWGLIQRWVETPTGTGPLFARANMLTDRASFRERASFQEAMNLRRCIIPFEEYDQEVTIPGLGAETVGDTAKIHRPNREMMAIAGIWDQWLPPDRSKVLRTFAAITVPANPAVGQIHDRMPAILSKADYDLWLNADIDDARSLIPLLKPYEEPLEITLPPRQS